MNQLVPGPPPRDCSRCLSSTGPLPYGAALLTVALTYKYLRLFILSLSLAQLSLSLSLTHILFPISYFLFAKQNPLVANSASIRRRRSNRQSKTRAKERVHGMGLLPEGEGASASYSRSYHTNARTRRRSEGPSAGPSATCPRPTGTHRAPIAFFPPPAPLHSRIPSSGRRPVLLHPSPTRSTHVAYVDRCRASVRRKGREGDRVGGAAVDSRFGGRGVREPWKKVLNSGWRVKGAANRNAARALASPSPLDFERVAVGGLIFLFFFFFFPPFNR